MLHLSTIDTSTLELLRKLMIIEEFSDLRLVGGTSLALQIGHRKSIDIDLFGIIEFESLSLPEIFADFKNTNSIKRSKNINIFNIDNVKVDFVNYSYPWLGDVVNYDGIRLAGINDIAAMKLAAITGRGSKKDFIDLYFLLQKFTLKEIMKMYSSKYFDGSEYLVLKSLTYFEDAEKDADVDMIADVSWQEIKLKLLEIVKEYSLM